ncbi:uncharacterized protein LOC126332414 [Schistocerca gregaria]|uniref:uncharacterized protein LOC126332414 n=1 Tax=Schistocerca gregaria TaxID=7010 RepID=UPI00211EE962|nr:uncharacterized protein LOC126332414 [Schistocerca gregaria]
MYATPLELNEEAIARGVVLKPTAPFNLSSSKAVKGYDFDNGVDFEAILKTFKTVGFQATNFGLAVDQVNTMINWRLSDEEPHPNEAEEYLDPDVRKNTKATIFFGFTSNMVSSGNREIIKFLCKHKHVDVVVTTAGGIEEDLMKVLAHHYLGSFDLDGSTLRAQGMNRIGNLLVPNDNYCLFESWIMPIFERMYSEQKRMSHIWTPSTLIDRLGAEIDNEESIYYWCHKNRIPVFCPAITDGSIGDMLTMFSFKHSDFICDVVQDAKKINHIAMKAKRIGQLILGGGVAKHHIFNASLFGNGADNSVVISTAQEYDGSDSGATLEEAKSWGKVKANSKAIKIFADATLIFPLLVAETFAKAKKD